MDVRPDEPERNILHDRLNEALDSGRTLPRNFVTEVVNECAAHSSDADSKKIVFVVDEYETFFGRMRTAVVREEGLRYTVVQPLLSQLVSFSQDNLLVFVGQRPDAHHILMDQNQLSPLVRQDPFPLFTHRPDVTRTEFTMFLRRVMSKNVEFDTSFATQVFRETSGHPYLTVNLMVDFFDWMIEGQRQAGTVLGAADFDVFARERLTLPALRASKSFEFFRNMIGDGLSQMSLEREPWLFGIFSLLRSLVTEHPKSMACGLTEFRALCNSTISATGLVAEDLLRTAEMGNFLQKQAGSVRPAIPLLGRIACVASPRMG
jgi:hypothetical protein